MTGRRWILLLLVATYAEGYGGYRWSSRKHDVVAGRRLANPKSTASNPVLTLEVGVFCDEACYRSYVPFLKTKEALREIILAMFSQLQVYFRPPWVRHSLEFKVVHLQIMEQQPVDLPEFGGDTIKILHAFSRFQKARNPKEGTPGHWDTAVLLTGVDLMRTANGKTTSSVLGKSWVDGFCDPDYSAFVVEFGVVGPGGVPAMSSGLQASHVMAHELGHNLGLFHDGQKGSLSCNDFKFMMSSWKRRDVLTLWSRCSKQLLEKLDRSKKVSCLRNTAPSDDNVKALNRWKVQGPPGQKWDVDKQCQVFLKDESGEHAVKYNGLGSICEVLKCKSPNRMGIFTAGGALEGSYCGARNWCQLGRCVPFPKSTPVVAGGWSKWTEKSRCSTSCLNGSVPLIRLERSCNNPPKKNTQSGCQGDDVLFRPCSIGMETHCDRIETNRAFIARKCAQFSKRKPELRPPGIQLPFDKDVSWRSCAIYCSYQAGKFMHARFSSNDVPELDAYLPDGASCGGKAPYYCQNRQCSSLLRGMHGMHKDISTDEIAIDVDDWASSPRGRMAVEKFLEYAPGEKRTSLKNVRHRPYKVFDPEDIEEKPPR